VVLALTVVFDATNFFSNRSHCTIYNNERSKMHEITASIVQGSAVGPASYVVTAADLRPSTSGNELCKYADDTYIIIPACNVDTRSSELSNVEQWAHQNNLRLNRSKTTEIIFYNRRRQTCHQRPAEIPGISRVTSVKILGVTVTDSLSMSSHVQIILNSCSQTLYALKTLRAHGLSTTVLHNVYRSVVLAKIMHAASAWYGFTTQADRQRIDALFRRGVRSGFCSPDLTTFSELCYAADNKLFAAILNNSAHVLNGLLPPKSAALQHYNVRQRVHDREIPPKCNQLTDSNFINRMLYRDCY
jgi:hypothetical protein